MGWRGPSRKLTGSRPSRHIPVRVTGEVNCLRCNVTIDTVLESDGLPVRVIQCPNCETVFNRETGEILVDKGKVETT
jgi:hypothetical protein